MAQELVRFEETDVPAIFQVDDPSEYEDLTSGVSAGFAALSFRGRAWRIRYKGDEYPITRRSEDGGEEEVSKLVAVILAANPVLTKTFYKDKYTPGTEEQPNCFSNDGVRPDPASPEPQASLCATCKWNQFGSRASDDGRKMKACSDARRLAVVPYPDMENEAFGGPMLLRVPPSALQDLARFSKLCRQKGVAYYGVVVHIGFDRDAEYPKPTFKPVAFVSDPAKAQRIRELRQEPIVSAILAEAGDTATPVPEGPKLEPAPEPKPEPAKAKPKQEPEPEPAADAGGGDWEPVYEPEPTPKAKAASAKPKPAPEPEPKKQDESDVDAFLDSLLSDD